MITGLVKGVDHRVLGNRVGLFDERCSCFDGCVFPLVLCSSALRNEYLGDCSMLEEDARFVVVLWVYWILLPKVELVTIRYWFESVVLELKFRVWLSCSPLIVE